MKSVFALVSFLFLLQSCKEKQETTSGGLSPQQALASFRLPEGFSIELVASEPLIADPVAMEVDENGSLYVVEMHGYPEDTSGTGAIKLLTDTDKDGLPDKSTVFADHLRLPTGIMRWKKGLLVVDVPNLLYLEDGNNDGRADKKEIMLTGLALTNPQHIANTPLFGLDNWIYLAHMGTITPKVSMLFNDSGSLVRFAGNANAPALPRNADGRNIRLKPDAFQLEMLAGESQYGQTFDNWGHQFCVENADHIFSEAIEARYLRRNPNLLLADASDYISDHGEACAVFPVTVNPENQLLTDRGVVTSACGITWYNGGAFPDTFNNVTFVCEPSSNLIHADRIADNGASFTASRLYPQKEFLASTDGWFRPVQQYIGPDGALYVIDYYRQIIEHPEWLSEEVIKSGALYNGHDKGRIYRIAPAGKPKMNWCNNVNLGKATTAQLVDALSSANIWWRRQAQRLLLDRKDTAAVAPLRTMIQSSHSATAVAHALWSLEGIRSLDEGSLRTALKSAHAGIRENAIKIAELHLADMPGIATFLPSMQNDSSAKVRYQLLCTLGDVPGPESANAGQQILLRDIEDKWVQTAALSSAAGNEWSLLQNTLSLLSTNPSAGKAEFFSNCAAVIGLSQNAVGIDRVFTVATANNNSKNEWWQAALLKGLNVAAGVNGLALNAGHREQLLQKFSNSTPPLVRRAAVDLLTNTNKADANGKVFQVAKAVAISKKEPAPYRADAWSLLALNKQSFNPSLAEAVIGADENAAVQQAAVKTYSRCNERSAANFLINHWSRLSQPVKEVGMENLLASDGNMLLLLKAVEEKKIATTDINWPQKVHLMNNDDERIRTLSRKLLASEIESREVAYKQYMPALNMNGDAVRGRTVFQGVCGTCHQYEGKDGKAFGPDIGTVRNRDKASIMADILDPNRSIAVKYDFWNITLKDGTKANGIVQAETPATTTLAQPGGGVITISRSSIKTMETSRVSAMPAGLEASLTKEQMADLLAFIRGKRQE